MFTSAVAIGLMVLGSGAAASAAEYALILHEEPVARRAGFQKGPLTVQMSAHRDVLRATQQSLRRELESRRFRVTGSAQVLLNAVFVHTSRDRVDELRALPGVDRVVFVPRARAKLNAAVQLVDAPAAWTFLGGIPNAGLGMKIADIDTGIEPSHPAFINNALPAAAGYPLCDPADCAFTSRKIIVARSYVQGESAGSLPNPAVDSRPDDNTIRDHYGHGTGVMSVAAGETNAGPAATITGIAPQAYLGVYKAGGTPGIVDGFTDAALIQALEDATTDGMDIVNMSLGALPFSAPLDSGAVCGIPSGEFCDPLSEAIEQATRSGVLVVVAAGNEGDIGVQYPNVATLNTVNSPGIAPSALAVAAAENSHTAYNQIHVHGGPGPPSNLANASILFGSYPPPLSAVRGTLRDTTTLGDALACTVLPNNSLSGDVALIERGTCNFSAKIQNAQDAGAEAVIVYDNIGESTLISMDTGSTTIPAVFLGNADGKSLAAYLKQNPTGVTATLDPYGFTLVAMPGAGQLVSFSSRGPSINGILKPDLTAIGDNMYLAAESFDANGIFSASGYSVVAGTSYATPMVTGAAALVKQHNPSLSPLQIKSALMNTAARTVVDPFTSGPASVTGAGAGMLDVLAALKANVSIVPSSVSFGFLKAGSLPITIPLQFTNTGSTAVSLSITVAPTVSAASAPVTVDQAAMALAPGNSAALNVKLAGTVPVPGIYEGNINILGAAVPLHIPYLFVVGDGVPFDAFALAGGDATGTVGQSVPDGLLAARILDQFGVPVPNVAVHFSVALGSGHIETPDPATDQYGLATAGAILSTIAGDNQFQMEGGGISLIFDAPGRPVPTIATHGATNAANSLPESAAAPGSYVALVGTGLSDLTDSITTTALMPSIDLVSVSFDVPSAGISVPARLYYVSPTEVGLQVPWEMQGQTSALIKVNIDASTGKLYTLPIVEYAPSFFILNNLLAAEDASYQLITSAHPATRGQIVLLYCNGLGPVNNQPADGVPASSSALSTTTTPPKVTIGGKQAQVLFGGLAPGFPGLYQLNVIVPADAPTGSQSVIVTIGGVASPAATLPVN